MASSTITMEEDGRAIKKAKLMARLVARPYQEELLKKALEQNSIVYLGTGAGKTFIASMIIKEKKGDILKRGKKTVFLVHRVPLVTQQAKFFEVQNPDLRVRSLSGSDGIDFWAESEWKKVIQATDIFVMVHDVLKLALHHKFIKISDINLLLVDECHHCLGNTPYNQIFREHYIPNKGLIELPHVVGLTASIVSKSLKNLEDFAIEINKVEEALDSKVITTKDVRDILKFVTQPDESFRTYQPPPQSFLDEIIENGLKKLSLIRNAEIKKIELCMSLDQISTKIRIKEAEETFKTFQRIVNQTIDTLMTLGMFHGEKILACGKESFDEEIKYNIIDPYKTDLAKVVREFFKETLEKVQHELSRFLRKSEEEKLNELSTHKVLILLEILQDFKIHNSDGHEIPIKALIFVQTRTMASTLASLISRAAKIKHDKLGHLSTSFAVGGKTGNLFKNPGAKMLSKDMQKELEENVKMQQLKLDATLKDFRSGKINCLVSTDVLEEGMDITTCNLVIRFDEITTFRSYVQSKGRARAKPSQYIVLVEAGKEDRWKNDLAKYKKMESKQIDECHDEIENYSDDDKSWSDVEEAYFANPGDVHSPRITSLTAISLVHQFIQTLPADRFTKLTAFFEIEERETNPGNMLMGGLGFQNIDGRFIGIVHMPHLTGYREPFYGDSRHSEVQAKRNVFLQICKKLHQDQRLDEHLLPRKRILDIHLEELNADVDPKKPKIGTRRSKNYYKIQQNLRIPDQCNTGYLHKISLKLEETSNYSEFVKQYKIYRPEKYAQKLGIIIGSRIPKEFSSFHIHTMSGKVRVELQYLRDVSNNIPESQNLIGYEFHQRALKDIIGFDSKLIQQDNNVEAKDDILIVPLGSNDKIDWVFLNDWWKREQDAWNQSKNFIFKAELYVNAVIIPQHRQMGLGRYFVEEIIYERTPNSNLPGDTQTYAQHYQNQYNKNLSNFDQPMLRISNADKKHFMFFPIHPDSTERKTKVNDDRTKFLDKKLLLIPELVKIHPISGPMWREIQMLPFILQRLNSLMGIFTFVSKLKKEMVKCDGSINYIPSFKKIERIPLKIEFEKIVKKSNMDENQIIDMNDILNSVTLKAAGEEFDMETLETLGDSFLKYFVTIGLFCNKSIRKGDEGYLTQYRSSLISNRRLFTLGVKKNLPEIISSNKFEPDLNWKPPRFQSNENLEKKLVDWDKEFRERVNLNLDEDDIQEDSSKMKTSMVTLFQMMNSSDWQRINEGSNFEGKEQFLKDKIRLVKNGKIRDTTKVQPKYKKLISDKSVADCIEALIGIHLVKGGQTDAAKFLSWLGLKISPLEDINEIISYDDDEEIDFKVSWFDNLNEFMPKSGLLIQESIEEGFAFSLQDPYRHKEILETFREKVNLLDIEAKLGYHFRDKSFLLQALTHCSYGLNKITDSCERIEFLGDAVLDFLITLHIMEMKGDKSPGELTNLRSALVNNNTLAGICVDRELNGHLLLLSPDLLHKITQYTLNYTDASNEITNSERLNENEVPEIELVEVPKALGDMIEAIIGAVYLDSKCDLKRTWSVVKKMYGKTLSDILEKPEKSFLAQLHEKFPQKIEFEAAKVRPHDGKVQITVKIDQTKEFKGIGANKKMAKFAAAKCALRFSA